MPMKKALNMIILLAIANTAQAVNYLIGGVGGMPANPPIVGYGSSSTGIDNDLTVVSPGSGDLPLMTTIRSVSLNGKLEGLVGGFDGISGYAALVSPDGVVTNVSLGTMAQIFSVSLNDQSIGLVGGNEGPFFSSGLTYAALISSGNAMSLSPLPSAGRIRSVDINNTPLGIIGGLDNTTGAPFVAFVSPSGMVSDISTNLTATLPIGLINSVSVNGQDIGLVGGVDNDTGAAYGAFVNQSGLIMALPNAGGSGNLPDMGEITSVDLNNSGVGIIGGGQIGGNEMYAAFVSPSGTVTNLPVSGSSFPVTAPINSINAVAINNNGAALLGGSSSEFGSATPYAGLVSSTGNLQNLDLGSFNDGFISSVDLSDEGIGIMGGTEQTVSLESPYAALVAPNGTVTRFPNGGAGNIPATGNINSVSLAPLILPDVVNAVVPKFIGPYGGPFNAFVGMSRASEFHTMIFHKNWNYKKEQRPVVSELDLLADAHEEVIAGVPPKAGSYSIWLAPFGNYVDQKAQGQIPSFSNSIGGTLLCIDYYQQENTTYGGGLGYAYDYVNYSQGLGHSNLNEEIGVLYASFDRGMAYLNVALWGGFYQVSNKRNSLGFITSTSSTQGYLLSPHFELCVTPYKTWFVVEPFVKIDWTNSWQKHFTESGASGFNLVMPGFYSSLLRSEVGLRLYENIQYQWGKFLIEEKVSYLNQTPFNTTSVSTSFVGSPSSFGIAVNSSKVENLAVGQLHFAFLPNNESYPYGAIDMQVEWSPSYQSYYAGFEIGKKF